MADTTRLPELQRRALDRLSAVPLLEGFYLAGGTAIAMHLGHRTSLDLDLFSLSPDTDLEPAKAAVRGAFEKAETVQQTDAAVHLLCDGTPIDLVRYPYPLLRPPLREGSWLAIAGLLDLATMKLSAIARRGLKRDFWDLETIVTRGGVPLWEASQAYLLRFGVAEADLYHVFRALTYFEEADKDPDLPAGLTPRAWQDLKSFFRREVPVLMSRVLRGG